MSLVLPFAAWPEADRTMWATLRRAGGPFDDRGALAHLRETSIETLAKRYGRWLEWLRRSEPAALDGPPTSRPTLLRVRAWLEALEHTKPMTRLMFVDGLLRVMTAEAPEADWSTLGRVKAHLRHVAGSGDPERKAGRILSSRVLLAAGVRLAEEASEATTPLQHAIGQRNGTMIALLAMMPMRRRAFASLELGTSLIVGRDVLTVVLSEELTKTGVPWEADVPEPADALLGRYIAETRPFLMRRGREHHDMLWVGDDGRPTSYAYMGPKIVLITERLTGKRIPPHFFRDAAATTLARESPEAARLVQPVLAHTGFGTAERHYIHARSIEAGRDYATLLKQMRKR